MDDDASFGSPGVPGGLNFSEWWRHLKSECENVKESLDKSGKLSESHPPCLSPLDF